MTVSLQTLGHLVQRSECFPGRIDALVKQVWQRLRISLCMGSEVHEYSGE